MRAIVLGVPRCFVGKHIFTTPQWALTVKEERGHFVEIESVFEYYAVLEEGRRRRRQRRQRRRQRPQQ